jgi:hypothetical protein
MPGNVAVWAFDIPVQSHEVPHDQPCHRTLS